MNIFKVLRTSCGTQKASYRYLLKTQNTLSEHLLYAQHCGETGSKRPGAVPTHVRQLGSR